jgi:hypothetical protein
LTITLLIAAVGLIVGLVSWLVRDSDAWWSSTLSNVAVAIVLLSPAEFAVTWIRNGFRRIEQATEDARATAQEAKNTADKTASTLADVREELLNRQEAELEENLDRYRSLTRDPSRRSLLRALRLATTDGLITAAGVRSPVWWTELHYRYVVDGPNGELEVRLEDDGGRVISANVWSEGEDARDFYQRLVIAVRDAGADLGTKLNDPTQSIEELSDMLTEVVRLRSQELMGHRQSLRKIIERVDGWYFTERYIIPKDHLAYTIEVDRLDHMDWEKHLYDKGWYDASTEIPFARRLYGLTASNDGSDYQ